MLCTGAWVSASGVDPSRCGNMVLKSLLTGISHRGSHCCEYGSNGFTMSDGQKQGGQSGTFLSVPWAKKPRKLRLIHESAANGLSPKKDGAIHCDLSAI